MTELTDFSDTSDVSDAAIEWVLRQGGHTVEGVRDARSQVQNWHWAKRVIMLARLIQQHRPELLVDPVDAIVREEMERDKFIAKGYFFDTAKRLYQMGLEAGKRENDNA